MIGVRNRTLLWFAYPFVYGWHLLFGQHHQQTHTTLRTNPTNASHLSSRKTKPLMKEMLAREEVIQGSIFFRNPLGKAFVRIMFRLTGMNRFNHSYNKVYDYKGVECAHASLEEWGVKLNILYEERLKQLPDEAFVVISNHPYGGLDGIAMLSIFGREKDSFMMIANDLLMRWEPMATRFLPVFPKGTKKKSQSNAENLKRIFEHMGKGGSIGIFPAGDVSRFKRFHQIVDVKWHPTAMKFVTETKCNVVPIYFHGRNSILFYALGMIHKELRMLFSPRELYNKRKPIDVSIGQTIPWAEIEHFTTHSELCDFLRQKTYELGKKQDKKR